MNSLTPPTVTTPPAPGNSGLPIAAVERETGLGKDTLRVWERRYRFPTPSRDSSGDRLYSLEQVQQLKLISRLLDSGLRPGKVVGLGQAALQDLLTQHAPVSAVILSKTIMDNAGADPLIEALLHAIGTHDPRALRHGLSHAQLRMGLAPFVTDLVAPLTTAVGEAWNKEGIVPLMRTARFWSWFDWHVIDTVVDGTARGVRALGGKLRLVQRGRLQISITYMAVLMAFALAFLALA